MNHSFVNLLAAIALSVAIIFGWQHFFEKPRLVKLQEQSAVYNQQMGNLKKQSANVEKEMVVDRQQAIVANSRVQIKSELLSGSISLKGLRFDDLTLLKYKQEIAENSPAVELFSPSNSENAYFAEVGWWGKDKSVTYPDSTTNWQTDNAQLVAGSSVNLYWVSPEKVKFKVSIYLDENYLFSIKQSVENHSARPISVQFYGLINKTYENKPDNMVNILHQGMIGAVKGELQEYTYDKIKDEKKHSFNGQVNWLGITDKYWLAAFVPDQLEQYIANYNFAIKQSKDKYQSDFITNEKLIESGGSFELTHLLFAGPKKVDLLDKYEEKYNIKLFDRAIDFGWFYILTKPIFNAMNYFYSYVGNFGISIMIVTILIKLAMFTLANKSYRSMKKMKKLQPEMERLKQLYADDKARLNQEVMSLYKREKVNPVSGCLPLLVQIPVFFSIYKVLYVTIEMRHAPFFGWIQDLSAPDPTTIFNLFGLLPFTPPSFLILGVWPLFMAMTMFLQQKMSPHPTDPVQAQVMKFMPLMFLFMFSGFPAGLLIYWSWNNILSIVQQFYINKLDSNGS
ncbi:MAG: membrane protein insertase YidC [Rickettsiaceae bacterium]|nr:membrane protein insertase YidC [Rickettsiaceae bacterium]